MIEEYKRIAIYPFNGELIGLVKYLNKYMKGFRVTELVIPSGWGINGKDGGVIFNKPQIGIIASDNFSKAMDSCDILIIADDNLNENLHQIIINNSIEAIKRKKDIICITELPRKEVAMLKKVSSEYEVTFKYSPEYVHWNLVQDMISIQSCKIYTPKAPIIFIGDLIEGDDGFNVLLYVTDYLKSNGYKTIAIGNRRYCEIIDLLSLPSFLTQTDITDNEKIYNLNNYIKYLDETEKPDIFVIQIPGGMMKYNDEFTNGFGVIPYLISQAVQGDFFILCSYYNAINTQFYKMSSNTFAYRFGFEINCIHMSNKFIDIRESIRTGKLSSLYLEQHMLNETIDKNNKKSEIPIYNIDNVLDRNKLHDQLKELLSFNEMQHII